MSKKHILIIDDALFHLKCTTKILEPYYKVTTLLSAEQGIKYLKRNTPDLILLDLHMSGMNGYDFVKTIKAINKLKDIPIIFFTSENNEEAELNCFKLGAVDFILKPISPQILLTRVNTQLELSQYRKHLEGVVANKTNDIENLQAVIIRCTAELVECRDKQTGGHVKRTATYVKLLCDEILRLGLYKDFINAKIAIDIIKSAPLHDVGKIGITDNVLLKNGKLNEEEFEYMRTHCELGGMTIQKMIDETNGENFLYIAKDMAYYHHEKWNGTGYPSGLSREEIPIPARIMAIADVYDALTTERPYKKAFSHEEAVEIMLKEDGKSFDPVMVYVFKGIHEKFKQASFENL